MKDGSVRTFIGVNKKKAPGPRKEGDECAEMEVIDAARKTGCVNLAGFVVVAPHQPDDATGLDLGATLPCEHCRARFRKELESGDSPLARDTRMIFVNVDDPAKRPELTVEKVLLLLDGKVT